MANLTPRRDVRTYEQLAEILRRQLPTAEWTDHNASDPGMMLLELLSWLGEMALYQMDRVPEAHQNKFLNFLIDPPEPVTVDVEFIATFQAAPATGTLSIAAGTRLATDFVAGRRFVFETYKPLRLARPDPPDVDLVARGTVKARAILEVLDEPLGVSDQRPHQTFNLRPPRQALGIADDAPAPILTDFVHRDGTYEPNPSVEVGTEQWTAESSLLTERAHIVTGGTEPGKRYMVDAPQGQIRFGDGVFGAIPPLGAIITCTRYAVLDGPAALIVREGDLTHLLNLPVPTDVDLAIRSSDAEGGAHFFPVSRRTELALREFRAPYRLITANDFERAVLEDFRAFQELSASTPNFLRAIVAFNRRPPLADDIDAPGHVTLVLIAGAPVFDETLFRDPTVAVAAKQAMLGLPEPLWRRLRRFLDPRRLITTKLHRETPTLAPFTMTATVVAAADRNLAQLQSELRDEIHCFLSLVSGGFDHRGWPLGRDVYRSQLYRLLEDVNGVDHVASLSLSPADSPGNVRIAPQQLPLLQALAVSVTRG